jgi:hypothetical protein
MGFHAKRYRGAPALLSAEAITIPSRFTCQNVRPCQGYPQRWLA